MAEDNNMNVFTTKIVNLPDLAKKYLFQVQIEFENPDLDDIFCKENDFIFRAKSVTIPQKEFTDMTTEYLGSKLVYPGKANVAGDVSINFDEFQDLWVSQAFHQWQNMIFNHGFMDDFSQAGAVTGGAISNYAKDYCAKIKIVLFDSTLRNKLPYEWHLYRCWPKTVSSVDLGMEDDGKIQRSVTLSYSTFEIVRT